jgi:hypothetical protein
MSRTLWPRGARRFGRGSLSVAGVSGGLSILPCLAMSSPPSSEAIRVTYTITGAPPSRGLLHRACEKQIACRPTREADGVPAEALLETFPAVASGPSKPQAGTPEPARPGRGANGARVCRPYCVRTSCEDQTSAFSSPRFLNASRGSVPDGPGPFLSARSRRGAPEGRKARRQIPQLIVRQSSRTISSLLSATLSQTGQKVSPGRSRGLT